MTQPLQTEAIKNFLTHRTHKDLADLYGANMEVQVMAAQDEGTVTGGEYMGHTWRGFTDGTQVWKSIRIPLGANSVEKCHYSPKPMSWDLSLHCEGIGLTGWDWEAKVSRWVGFDFDAMIGHSTKHDKRLSDEELTKLEAVVREVPWVTLRRSTGGRGLHIYVMLDGVPTATHTEHAALARSILGLLAAETGHPLHAAVDICGHVLWVWHRKMTATNGGLQLLKQGTSLSKVPQNWKDHLDVVTGKRKRSVPSFIKDGNREGLEKIFEQLSGQNVKAILDEQHQSLIKFLQESDLLYWFDPDNHMLVTHTASLAKAHTQLGLKGVFKTIATGTDANDHNCFMYPIKNGAWAVRRYSPGVAEAETWSQDGNGWTKCYFNREPDLRTAAQAFGGVENKNGEFIFTDAETAAKAATQLGARIELNPIFSQRPTRFSLMKDGRLHVQLVHEAGDKPENMLGWHTEKGHWKRIFEIRRNPEDALSAAAINCDSDIRHIVANGEDYGWAIHTSGWQIEPLTHVKIHLAGLGLKPQEINQCLGSAISNPWKMVNRPFEPEYPGEREWNKDAVQFRWPPSPPGDTIPTFPTWDKVLRHCGEGLDTAIAADAWCSRNGILTGRDYLLHWIASLFQKPTEPLPYLFFWGAQDSGKSIFHEAIAAILTGGVESANVCLFNNSGFNGELEHAVLCVVEEIDLTKNNSIYNKIKELVTARTFLLHKKNITPCSVVNTLHWVQCGNDRKYVPISVGDTRIVVTQVQSLDPSETIPKTDLIRLLERESPDFIRYCLDLHLPKSNSRLALPVIVTADKTEAERDSMNLLEAFISEHCYVYPGNMVEYDDFWQAFFDNLPDSEKLEWSKTRMGKSLPLQHGKGKLRRNNRQYIINISLSDPHKKPKLKKLMIKDGYIALHGDVRVRTAIDRSRDSTYGISEAGVPENAPADWINLSTPPMAEEEADLEMIERNNVLLRAGMDPDAVPPVVSSQEPTTSNPGPTETSEGPING